MTIASMDYLPDQIRLQATPVLPSRGLARRLRVSTTKLILIVLSALLLCASIVAYSLQGSFFLAGSQNGQQCNWHNVVAGDTLSGIALQYHTTISALAHANTIRNLDLIFVGQRLCISSQQQNRPSGLQPDGTVRWYAHDALEHSKRSQVRALLYRVAAQYRLSPKLLLAVAWQESGWTQQVVSWDGGIGVMQLMPYTAAEINSVTGQRLDPYVLWDNLRLGAIYLQWLSRSFPDDMTKVISAYNQGGWAVVHRGIFNWSYVNNVRSLMKTLN